MRRSAHTGPLDLPALSRADVRVRALRMHPEADARQDHTQETGTASAVTAMRVFLIHIRDPQFCAVPAATRAGNGNIRVMGFPPIGIMTLSAVLKRAGHECVMFDQANPETPNDVIIEEIRRQRPALVGLSFLSTTSYPYAKILARQIRAADAQVRLAFGGVFATLNARWVKSQCPEVDFVCRGDGEQLLLDLVAQLDDPANVPGVTWAKDGALVHNPDRVLDRNLDQWPFPDRDSLPLDFIESMPLDVPAVLSMERFTTMQTSRGCPWPCVFCDIPVFNHGKWRSRSPQHVVDEFNHLQALGYGTLYIVDDNFLLHPKRIEAICKGITDTGISIQWGCEGRVDSTGQHLFPAMAKAHCRTLMFGIESGSQKVLDRLKKQQTLAEVEAAVTNAKRAGIEIVHGFFVVGSPDETVEDMRATFDFAAKLRLDTFAFNRLCVYRGTPLWQEYVSRGLVSDEADWYKYFKCSEIDPSCLPGEVINAERAAGFRRLFRYKLTHYPIQTLRLLRRFLRHMRLRDVVYLIIKPFLGNQRGPTENEVLSRSVEDGALKEAAAGLTQGPDALLQQVIKERPSEPPQSGVAPAGAP
jgi:anaerobic magnesium-protoporphyrin IX monomethyl ester cyclase